MNRILFYPEHHEYPYSTMLAIGSRSNLIATNSIGKAIDAEGNEIEAD
jgi:hypothetical protein